jgi:hypothetical protein
MSSFPVAEIIGSSDPDFLADLLNLPERLVTLVLWLEESRILVVRTGIRSRGCITSGGRARRDLEELRIPNVPRFDVDPRKCCMWRLLFIAR